MITILNQTFVISQNYLIQPLNKAKGSTLKTLSHKLSNKSLNPKKYSPLLKIVLNGKTIPFIPQIYLREKFLADTKENCDLFNSYFAEQCTPLLYNSNIPSFLTVNTESLLGSFHFSANHVRDVIKKMELTYQSIL